MSNLSVCSVVADCEQAVACNNGLCICEPNWSTDMDFLTFQTCATSTIAMYILWALNILLIVYVLYKSAFVILLRFENFFEQRKVKRNYTLFQNKGLIGIILEFGISIPCQLAMAILKLTMPTTRVGFDLLPTLLFFFAKFGFYSCVVFVQGPMLAVTLRGDPNKQKIVRLGYFSGITSSMIAIINGALPLITYVNYSTPGFEKQQLAVMQAYYFIQVFAMAINFGLSIVIMQKVSEAFSRAEDLVSDTAKKNENIKKKVNDLQSNTMRQAALQGVIYLLMGAVPFLWTRHAYFLPISWLAMPLLGMKLAHQVTLDKKGAKSIMQRLGIVKTSTFGESKDKNNNSSALDNTRTNNQAGSYAVGPLSSSAQGKRLASSVISETTQIEELMDPEHPSHEKFLEFVKSKFATSELELLEQLLQYKRSKSSKERKKVGNNIMKRFIIDGAPQQVDIPDGIRKILVSTAAKGMFVEGTFDSVRGPLLFDIKGNFFAPFEKKMSMTTFNEDNI